MLTKDEYIQLISQSIQPSAEAFKNDPFEYLLKQIPKNIIEKYVDSQAEDIIPSTSDDVRTVNSDARIQFSQIIGGLYLDLAALLKSNRATCSDEYQLLSLQDVATINASFQFFILTGILPFLEPGTGLPAAARSSFIKSWKLYDGNKETCVEKLTFAAKVLVALLECNDALAVQFLPKYIHDVLAVRFSLSQLQNLDFEPMFVEIFRKCPSDIVLSALMFLTQDRKPTKTPNWMKTSCGRELTKILIAKDGLLHLLQYYQERAGDTWTDNLPLTKQVAWHLATVPRMFKHPMEYHERMSRQFFETIWSQKVLDKNLLNVFIGYVEELRTRFSRNADVTIFDQLMVFWELLGRKIADKTNTNTEQVPEFSPNHIRNIELLAQVQASADVRRVRNLHTVLFACIETVPYVKEILKASLDATANLGYVLYQHVMTPTHAVILKRKAAEQSSLIQEIGPNGDVKKNEPVDEMWLQGIEDPDLGISRRLEDVFYVVDNAVSQAQFRTIMEMMSVGLEDFLKVSEKERDDDAARFVDLGAANTFSSFHAHLVVGCCFERMTNMSMQSGFSQDECGQLLKMSENILNNASSKFIRLAARKRSVDVFQLTESEKKEFTATRDTAKLALPMVSTLLMFTHGSHRLQDIHSRSVDAMANFTRAVDAFPCDDLEFNNTLEETKRLLRELKVDFNNLGVPPVPMRTERRRYSGGDICHELIEELSEDEPAIRGGTLMTIAKAFRNKTHVCGRLIEYGVYDIVKELIDDDDSYVFLGAINCLCEISVYDRRLFEDTVAFYEELANSPNKTPQIIVRIARLAEAVGKLFQARGDFSVTYVDRMAAVFMRGMNENDDLLRASSCGAFGNFLLAVRGRGVERWLQQLFHQLHQMIQVGSSLVRRAATDLVRQCLRSCGSDVFELLRENLLDLHREVRKLSRNDSDEVVRLHASLCIEEIEAALRQNTEDTERGYSRRIRL